MKKLYIDWKRYCIKLVHQTGFSVEAIHTAASGPKVLTKELVDVFCLRSDSLLEWLRRHGEKNVLAEHLVAKLLGHDTIHSPEELETLKK